MANKSISLGRLVEERALSKKKLEEEKRKLEESLIPYIPKECISRILVRLPIEALPKMRLVCKTWYRIINSAMFAQEYFERSESCLIFLIPRKRDVFFPLSPPKSQEKPNVFSVESKLFQLQSVPLLNQPFVDPSSLCHLQFMDIRDGKARIEEYNATCLGKIRACCDGLILLDNSMKRGGLIALNPVTRDLSALPVGTIFTPHSESYGLAFCHSAMQFKLVHLFRDELQYIGCEILNLGAKSWRMVDGPAFGLFGWFGYDPVFAVGALHWVPYIDHSEYIVSMTVNDETFQQIPLPTSCRILDRLIEIHGHLGFVSHEESNKIDLWVLKSLCGEGWAKQHTIFVGTIRDMVPLYFSRINGELIFKDKSGHLHAYDCSLQLVRKLEIPTGRFLGGYCYFAHVNSLLSWKVKDQDVFD